MTNATGSMNTARLPPTIGIATVATSPMSWKSGSHSAATEVLGSARKTSQSWAALAVRLAWVISTPVGARVEPEVYCR